MRSVLNRVGMVVAMVLGCGWTPAEASDAWGRAAYGGASTAALGGGYELWGLNFASTADCCSDVWAGYCNERHGWGCGHDRHRGDCRGHRGGLFHRHGRCHGARPGSCCHQMDDGVIAPGTLDPMMDGLPGPIDEPPVPVEDNAA